MWKQLGPELKKVEAVATGIEERGAKQPATMKQRLSECGGGCGNHHCCHN
jgi:hypothetical protein